LRVETESRVKPWIKLEGGWNLFKKLFFNTEPTVGDKMKGVVWGFKKCGYHRYRHRHGQKIFTGRQAEQNTRSRGRKQNVMKKKRERIK
jgi:hypothetical protein